MKIIQEQVIDPSYEQVWQDSWTLLEPRIYFDPSWFTGIKKIYMEFTGWTFSGNPDASVKLFDITHNQDIPNSQIDVTSGAVTRYRTGDLSASLTEPCELGIKVIRNSTYNYLLVQGTKLVVQHESSSPNRKTMSRFNFYGYTGVYSSSYQFLDNKWAYIPKIDLFDGTVVCKFECYLQADGYGTAYTDLYDVDAGSPVAGSELFTNSTTLTRLTSGKLTLNPSHRYRPRIKIVNGQSYMWIASPSLLIYASGFQKIVANCCFIPSLYVTSESEYVNQRGIGYFDPDNIDGVDGLSYKAAFFGLLDTYTEKTVYQRIYNKTASEAIPGTTHSFTLSSPTEWFNYDDPTMPSVPSELVFQAYGALGIFYTGPGYIYALQQENFPSASSLPADPMQPSGYHCFMNQFLRNVLAGLVPLKTPDGVNKCW